MKLVPLIIIISQLTCSAQTFLNFQEDSLWGLMNENGDTLIKPQFDYVYGWNNVAFYHNGKKGSDQFEAGLITEDLRIVPLSNRLPINIAFGSVKRYTENYFFFWGKEGKGVVNCEGEIVVPPIFDRLESFDNENEALCRKGRLWGVIDIQGNFIIRPKYFSKEKVNLLHLHAKAGLAKRKYTDIKWDQRRNGMVPVYKGRKPVGQYGDTENKWGFISEKGQELSDFIYPESTRFTNGVAYVKINGNNFVIRHRDFLPHNLNEETVVFERGPVSVTRDTNRLTGELISVVYNRWKENISGLGDFEFAYPLDTTLSVDAFTVIHKYREYYDTNYHFGVFNLLACRSIIEPRYDRIEVMPNRLFMVEKDNKVGLTSGGSSWMVSLDYDSIRYISNDSYELHKNGIKSSVNIQNRRDFRNSYLEASGDTSIHYKQPNEKDYLIVGNNEYYIYKPKFERRNEILKYVQRMNKHVVRIELQFGDWGYINIDSGELIYWNGLTENRNILEPWARHLPLLYRL